LIDHARRAVEICLEEAPLLSKKRRRSTMDRSYEAFCIVRAAQNFASSSLCRPMSVACAMTAPSRRCSPDDRRATAATRHDGIDHLSHQV
jgi:hypothetical protein